MPGKSLGSDSDYITPNEAAEMLGVTAGQVHAWSRSGLIDPHYPEGPRPNRLGGKRFLREDVFCLMELREQSKGPLRLKIPQLAMRAFVSSRRTERKLNELMLHLGLSTHSLGLEEEQVKAFYLASAEFIMAPGTNTPAEIAEWSQKLMGITGDYLTLVAQVTGDKECWRIFAKVGAVLTHQCSAGTTARAYVDNACMNLQNASYLFVRGLSGQRTADKMFPKEGYITNLVRTFYPKKI